MPSPTAQALLDRRFARLDHELAYASSKQAERDLDQRSEARPRYSNIEPNTGLRRHGEI